MSAVRRFYDKLIHLPLEEEAPAFYTHHLITKSTLERVNKSSHIRAEKSGFILQDVIETVQQKPDMLDVFCDLLQNLHVAAELAQLIKGMHLHLNILHAIHTNEQCALFSKNDSLRAYVQDAVACYLHNFTK